VKLRRRFCHEVEKELIDQECHEWGGFRFFIKLMPWREGLERGEECAGLLRKTERDGHF